MAIPTVFAPVKPQDFTLNPVRVHKTYRFNGATLIDSSSGYLIHDAVHTSLKTPIGTQKAANDPTNSFDGSYQHIIWKSLDHMYYRDPYNPTTTREHSNRRYTFKFLNYSASVLSVPYMDYGEEIKPGSVFITQSGYYLSDDANGNIYDVSIDTGSYTNRYALVGYWGFNELFRKTKYQSGQVDHSTYHYISNVYQVDRPAILHNIKINKGVPIDGVSSGTHAEFFGNSYVLTYNYPNLNFYTYEDFTISFWVNAPATQSNTLTDTNTIISKNGSVVKQVHGFLTKPSPNDIMQTYEYVSSSLESSIIDRYPYRFEIYNHTSPNSGKIKFTRSDGIHQTVLTSSTAITDAYHHIAVTKVGNLLSLYVDGVLDSSGSDATLNPGNDYNLVFGADSHEMERGFSGSLDEVRIYNEGYTSDTIQTLADNVSGSMYQTAVVGNVFYKGGKLVISPLNPKYNDTLKGGWSLMYKGTHTIYQYEVLCRIKKGSFNLTYNPTARIHHTSDLLISDMTGSLLLPYVTAVGLYNSQGDLVAVGKMGQPLQMRDDVDMNILIRWDT